MFSHRVQFALVLATVSALCGDLVSNVSQSAECQQCVFSGLNCGGFCSDTGFTYTQTETYVMIDPTTGQTTTITFTTPYRIFKRCTDGKFGEMVAPWPLDPVGGNNQTAADAGIYNCNAATVLYRYLGSGGGGSVNMCSDGVIVSPTDPWLFTMTPAQKACSIFINDCNDGVVVATKNCRTGLPLNPPMPPMP